MENLIPADEFCLTHNIDVSFIRSLQETGLIEITTIEETTYIHSSQLHELERIVHLYFELDINLEGIESPGLTASPAIAQYVSKLVDKLL